MKKFIQIIYRFHLAHIAEAKAKNYSIIKNVPNDNFNNAEILREAKKALEKALVD